MKLLLDTHVWLWSRLAPERLGERSRALLEDPESELCLSPITVWETLMLIEKGRLEVDAEPREWVLAALRTRPMRECPLTHEVSIRSRTVVLAHQDPADRFLAATAIVYEATLLTADSRLLVVPDLPLMRAD